jgi:hypothetical protein
MSGSIQTTHSIFTTMLLEFTHTKQYRYYVPRSSFTSDANLTEQSPIDGTNGAASLGRLTVGNRSIDRVVIFNTKALQDLVKIDFRAIDQWFEEPIFCHPKGKRSINKLHIEHADSIPTT